MCTICLSEPLGNARKLDYVGEVSVCRKEGQLTFCFSALPELIREQGEFLPPRLAFVSLP